MKKRFTYVLFTAIQLSFLMACSGSSNGTIKEKIEDSGIILVENGLGKKDSVSYDCIGCSNLLKKQQTIDQLIEKASKETKTGLNYPLSFKPKSIHLTMIKEDSLISFDTKKRLKNVIQVIVEYNYIAKNGYGNELEGDNVQTFYLQDEKIKNLSESIQLEPLSLIDGSINRSLDLVSHNGNESMSLLPTKDGSIIVMSSIGCVDEGTWLIFELENGEEIKLVSWNDFNCEGKSYFKAFSSSQKEKLLAKRLKSIGIFDDKGFLCPLPKNQTDYFQQYLKLL
ncbi:MAG: hypothetical protein IT221_10390 [Fluviicola sp.]|nr:hypothetical protein [Fluviicola sp.]